MKAKQILLLASGSGKTEIISKLAYGKINTLIPASLLQVHQNVTIVVDEEAGALLTKKQTSLQIPLNFLSYPVSN